MDNSQVAHLWANQSRAEAHGSHFYFEGATIYSYGRHFPIATHVKNKKGKAAVLFINKGYYSVTTQKHIGLTASASRHITTFHVSSLDNMRFGDPAPVMLRQEFAGYKERVIACLRDAGKTRKRAAFHMERAETIAKEANAFAEFFGLRLRVKIDSDSFVKLVAQARRKETMQAKAEAARLKKVSAQLEAQDKEDRAALERWQAGEGVILPQRFARLPVALRISLKEKESREPGDILSREKVMETSHGATVPYEAAKKATRFVCVVRRAGIGWRRNGETFQVGDFHLDSVSETGDVVAGCHRIKWEEIERLGKAEGWL